MHFFQETATDAEMSISRQFWVEMAEQFVEAFWKLSEKKQKSKSVIGCERGTLFLPSDWPVADDLD